MTDPSACTPSGSIDHGALRGYRDVAGELRRRIEAEEVSGGRLPSEAELVAEFRVARDTVRRALALLVEEDLIRSTHGRGHFVRGSTSDASFGTPRYMIIVDSLTAQIHSGQLPAGSPLPSESEVQAQHQVSRNTARRALAEMESRGTIEKRAGRRYVREVAD